MDVTRRMLTPRGYRLDGFAAPQHGTVPRVTDVNGSRWRALAVVPAGDGYGLARVVVAMRVAVVVSIAVLAGKLHRDWMRRHIWWLAFVLVAALAYAAIMFSQPRFEVRRTRDGWLVSALDATLTLLLIWLTGGAASPVVVVLVLVVIASAARLSLTGCLVLAAALAGGGYLLVVLVPGQSAEPAVPGIVLGLWWALYAVFIAMLSGGLSVLAEREQRSRGAGPGGGRGRARRRRGGAGSAGPAVAIV